MPTPLPPAPAAVTRPFAGRAAYFAKHASRWPGFPLLPLVSAAIAALLAIAGGFGTGALPPGTRAAFWFGLIGWNALKWQLWFALTVRQPADWRHAAAIGALLLNLPLPLEIETALRLAGVEAASARGTQWAQALAISALVFVTVGGAAAVVRHRRTPLSPTIDNEAGETLPVPALLARAGIDEPSMLLSIAAEDHYCRFRLADGRAPLLHCRFGDALAAVTALDGAQVHRGLWVARHAVAAAERDGRRWRLRLVDGSVVAVSTSFTGALRTRGWLNPGRSPRPA